MSKQYLDLTDKDKLEKDTVKVTKGVSVRLYWLLRYDDAKARNLVEDIDETELEDSDIIECDLYGVESSGIPHEKFIVQSQMNGMQDIIRESDSLYEGKGKLEIIKVDSVETISEQGKRAIDVALTFDFYNSSKGSWIDTYYFRIEIQ